MKKLQKGENYEIYKKKLQNLPIILAVQGYMEDLE